MTGQTKKGCWAVYIGSRELSKMRLDFSTSKSGCRHEVLLGKLRFTAAEHFRAGVIYAQMRIKELRTPFGIDKSGSFIRNREA